MPNLQKRLSGVHKMTDINFCGFCGEELPPYNIWKWCLCPKCEKSTQSNKLNENLRKEVQ